MSDVICFGERIVLIKPVGKLDIIGQHYEVGGITEEHIIIRDITHRCAVASIKVSEFDKYFSPYKIMRKWTDWGVILDDDGISIAGYYRTNGKKVQVKRGKVKAEASCSPDDTFNLTVGITLALLRCKVKCYRNNDDVEELQINRDLLLDFTNKIYKSDKKERLLCIG